jgi:hypothetical protein
MSKREQRPYRRAEIVLLALGIPLGTVVAAYAGCVVSYLLAMYRCGRGRPELNPTPGSPREQLCHADLPVEVWLVVWILVPAGSVLIGGAVAAFTKRPRVFWAAMVVAATSVGVPALLYLVLPG